MMKIRFVTAISLLLFVASTHAADGMINVASNFGVAETADRLENLLKEKGMTVFNRIDHSANASAVGIELRETVLLVFGNPKVGSQLMKCRQSTAIDLPQKALVWGDENSRVWISYNDPEFLAARHHSTGCEKVTSKVAKALADISRAAAAR